MRTRRDGSRHVTNQGKLALAGQPRIEHVIQTIQGVAMNAQSENTADRHGCGTEEKPVGAGGNLPRSMDPNYSKHAGPSPSDHPAPRSAESRPTMKPGDFEWMQTWRDEQAAKLKTELRFQLKVMPPGQRIRTLRAVLGWTQRRIAMELGVSMRTVIRHERDQRRTLWLRLPVLLRLRQLESDHEEELVAFFTRVGRVHA